jgi:hypothetical protein
MTEEEMKKYGMPVIRESEEIPMLLTRETVKKLSDNGMTIDQIIEQLKPSYPNMHPAVMRGKISILLSNKPLGRPKKKFPEEAKNTDETMDSLPSVGEQLPGFDLPPVKSAEEISATNNHEDHPEPATIPEQPETEEYPNIKETAEEVGRQFDQVAKDSMDRVKLAHEVDKMLELLPEPEVNHPAHYTVGKIEVIDYLQDKMPPEMFEGFCVGNALKYISRYRFKGGVADLKKAAWYLNKIIGVKESA